MTGIKSIRLDNVLPQVFVDVRDRHISEVWATESTFNKGSYYMVEAESGTGKSSLCSFIYGNRTDYIGHIYFDDVDIRNLNINQWCDLRRHSLALLPQEMRLFPELTALENVEIKNRLTNHLSIKDIKEMFERLEIAEKIDQKAAHLSIGQQQRVAVIRSLAQPFDFILLDEPVSHLDSRNNHIAASLILDRASAQGAAILATSVGNPLLLEAKYQCLSL